MIISFPFLKQRSEIHNPVMREAKKLKTVKKKKKKTTWKKSISATVSF